MVHVGWVELRSQDLGGDVFVLSDVVQPLFHGVEQPLPREEVFELDHLVVGKTDPLDFTC